MRVKLKWKSIKLWLWELNIHRLNQRLQTVIVRKVCSDCLIYTTCNEACEGYYNKYVPIVEWLSDYKHKVSEKEFGEKLDECYCLDDKTSDCPRHGFSDLLSKRV